MKLSRLTRVSILLAVFFAIDKGLAILRQLIIARQFGPTHALDSFNIANNIPDMLYAVISGGALAIAIIPVLATTITKDGRPAAWDLFSKIANLAFIVTGTLSLLVAVLAEPLVRGSIGVAPGFDYNQQTQVITLMRFDLVATMIFSISGLIMAGLQANQHFLLPAMAPLLYNLGQIFGATVLAPEKGYHILGVTLPALGMGVMGLVYGVIIGAILHLLIQVPGLIKYQFHWKPLLDLKSPEVVNVLKLLGPRVLTMAFLQLTFIIRDNLASRLAEGAVSTLTYGYMIQQVPETLIGTAIGTAILPTLAEQLARGENEAFRQTLERAIKVLIALTIPIAVVMSLGLKPLIGLAFKFDDQFTDLMMWVTRGFLLGLVGHCIKEVALRSFYARQKPIIPLITSALDVALYIGLGSLLFRQFNAPGISLTDSIVFTSEAVVLFFILNRQIKSPVKLGSTWWRTLLAATVGGGVTYLIMMVGLPLPAAVVSVLALVVGVAASLPLIWPEMRILLRL
jgi:putative peptidoglycan lipid II flippase